MDRSDLLALVAPWCAIPLTALDWWLAWDRLPARVVMHVAENGRTSTALREDALMFDLRALLYLLCAHACVTLFVNAVDPARTKAASAVVGLAVLVLFAALNWVLWTMQVG